MGHPGNDGVRGRGPFFMAREMADPEARGNVIEPEPTKLRPKM